MWVGDHDNVAIPDDAEYVFNNFLLNGEVFQKLDNVDHVNILDMDEE